MLAETRYTCAADLCAAIRAAAVNAPEFRPEVGDTRGRYVAGPGAYLPGNNWADWQGPLMPIPDPVRIGFAYADPHGTRGRLSVEYLRPALLRLADRVHAARGAFDGKVKAGRCPTSPSVAKGSAPHVAARALWAAGDHADSLTLAQNHGAVFFGHPGKGEPGGFPYMAAQAHEFAGHGFTIARAIRTGQFRVLHTRSGLAVDRRTEPGAREGFSAYSAALDWVETQAQCEAWRAKLDGAAAKAPDFDQAAALAHYFADPAEPGAPPATQSEALARVDPPATQSAPDFERYRFDAHLIGTDSHVIETRTIVCAGRGLDSPDIAKAHETLRAMAQARGLRIVDSNFSEYAARAWCEPMPAPAAPSVTVRYVSDEEFDAEVKACQARADREETARRTAAAILDRFDVSSADACPLILRPECARIEAECRAMVESERNPAPPGYAIPGEPADPPPTQSERKSSHDIQFTVRKDSATRVRSRTIQRLRNGC